LRKREEKSYVESPDMIFEDPENAKKSVGRDRDLSLNATNGDVDMVSEPEDNEPDAIDDGDEDSDDGKPLPPMPSPSVSVPKEHPTLFLNPLI